MINHSSLRGLFLPFVFSIGLLAQIKNPGPGSPTLPGGSSNSTIGAAPSPLPPVQQPPDRPFFLTGKVMLDNGTPPSDPVVIQISCRGASRRSVAYTDTKGDFTVDLADHHNQLFDASDQPADFASLSKSPNMPGTVCPGDPELMGAEVQASLAGFRSDSINLGQHRRLDNPDIGIIVLHRLANVEGLTISATSGLAPKDAQKALEKELDKAVSIYPKYAAAWLELGNLQQRRKDLDDARKSYAKSLEADPKFVSPYLQLAMIAGTEQKWQDVADDTDRLLHLNPFDFPEAWLYNALANYYLKKPDVAEKSAREGISHDPSHQYPRMNYVLGILLAQKADYTAAAQSLRDYLQYAPHASDADAVRKQLADIEKAAGPEAKK